jgi:hypothetical protein
MFDQWFRWLKFGFLLVLALLINTYLVDELQAAFNESLPFLKVHIQKKLGWKMCLAASAAAIASVLSFIISYWILKVKTHIDHENLTSEENEWKEHLESKKKVSYQNAFGDKVEWKNQIKYKKERIGPWTWSLPIMLCLVGCGLGIAANHHPKLDVIWEPKGRFGRAIESVMTKVSLYEKEMTIIKTNTEEDCVPFATFQDVLRNNMDNRTNLLMKYTSKFFDETEAIVQPLKELVKKTRQKIGNQIFGEELVDQIGELSKVNLHLNLQFLPWLLFIPKVIQLFILLFGMINMSVATCFMSIVIVDPKKMVDMFGYMCMFSFVYCILTQIALFNILTDFGVPFYRVHTAWGLGFLYDVASEAVMWSIWIGMKNQFFFAIPKKQTTVTYNVPGASDFDPDQQEQNQII